jgi:serine/threonine-protein kinase
MEYVRGRTLRAILDDEGEMGLEPQRALGIIREAAIATAAAHGAGILHRDLKPSNLIVREKGGVSILDFGFAREQSPDGLRLTHASQILGTPQYMSPEQALGEDATERTDVYALGIIAFEVVTGHVPFQAANAVALALKHLHEPVPDDLQLFPGFSRQARAAIIRALAKNPADRFQTALAFSRALSDS